MYHRSNCFSLYLIRASQGQWAVYSDLVWQDSPPHFSTWVRSKEGLAYQTNSDLAMTYHKWRTQGESLATTYFLDTKITCLMIRYVLISDSPSHVHYLELQIITLTVSSKEWECFVHQLVALIYEIWHRNRKQSLTPLRILQPHPQKRGWGCRDLAFTNHNTVIN